MNDKINKSTVRICATGLAVKRDSGNTIVRYRVEQWRWRPRSEYMHGVLILEPLV